MIPTPPRPEISVIVVSWNGRALLDECLGALAAQSLRDFEVILVDNGSTDGSPDWVARHHPGVRLLRLGANAGFSAGNNAALPLARGRYLALLNNDTRVEPDWLAALHRRISTDPGIAACDSKVLYYDRPGVIWAAGASYTVAGSVQARWSGRRDGPDTAAAGEVFVAVACAAIYRRTAVDALGLFDESFFAGYEDVDWSFRARLAGYRIVNEPAARVHHKVSLSQGHNSPGFVRHGQRNVSAVFLKNMPAPLLARYWPLHLLYAAGSLVYFAKIGRAGAFLRGKRELLRRLPAIRRQRARAQSLRTATIAEIDGALDRRWLPAKLGKLAGGGSDVP